MNRIEKLKPPVKWAGGKRWFVPHFQTLWEPYQHRRLVEPFCGGLSVSLGMEPSFVLANDINPYLISFYQWLKRGLVIDMPMHNNEEFYYQQRNNFNHLIRSGEGASRAVAMLFYYLNRTGYNGLCRFNQSGGFNVPFGSYKTINYTRDFTMYQAVIKHWQFTSVSYEHVHVEPSDFIYADPPFDGDATAFVGFSKEGFTWEDQVRLAAWLAAHAGPVVAANKATPRILDLYAQHGFTQTLREAPRRINNTGDRTPVTELVATKNL